MFLLLRTIRVRTAAAAVGALGFGLSGWFLSYLNLVPHMFALAWVPLILAFVIRAIRGRSIATGALASLAWGMQLLAGEPGTIVQTGVLAFAAAVAATQGPSRRRLLRGAGALALIATGALAVGAVQIVPAIDLAGDSIRSRGLSFEAVSGWSLPPVRPLEMLFPRIFGHPAGLNWGVALYPHRGAGAFLLSLYVGLPLVIFTLAGIACRRRGWLASLLLMTLSYIAALGSHTPLLRALYDAGIFRSFRYPEKFILMALFTVVTFGAVMLGRAMRGDRPLLRAALAIAWVITAISVIAAAASFTPWYASAFPAIWGRFSDPVAGLIVEVSRTDWIVSAVRSVFMTLLLIALLRRGATRAWAWLLVLFLLYDLGTVANQITRRMPPGFFDRPPAATLLGPDAGGARLFHEGSFEDGFTGRAPAWSGDTAYWMKRNSLYPYSNATWGIRSAIDSDYDATALLPTVDLFEATWRIRAEAGGVPDALLAMSNVGAVFEKREDLWTQRVVDDPAATVPVTIRRVANPGRYYFAERLVRVASPAEFATALLDGSAGARDGFVGFAPFVPAAGEVISVQETFNTASIRLRTYGRSYLIAANTHHKYWNATLDGKRVPLSQTNVGYQGMEVPAGDHRVVLRYRNPLVDAFGVVSIAATLALLVAGAFGFRRSPGQRYQ